MFFAEGSGRKSYDGVMWKEALQEFVPWSKEIQPGIVLRGVERISGDKPILHFIHGNGFCGQAYMPFLSRFLDEYDVFLSDVQAHGDSDAGTSFPGWNRISEHCLEVLLEKKQEWAGKPVIGMGHSFGAVMSSLMVDREPGIFERMIFLDPVIFTPWMYRGATFASRLGFRNPLSRKTRKRKSQWKDLEEARGYFQGRGIFRGWAEASLEAYLYAGFLESDDGGLELKCPPWFEAMIFATTPKGVWRALRRIPVPTHILYGRDTYPFVIRSVKHAMRINPQITGEMVDGDHCFMQQHPEATYQIIRKIDG